MTTPVARSLRTATKAPRSCHLLRRGDLVPSLKHESLSAVLAVLPDFAIFQGLECLYAAVFAEKVSGIEDVEHFPSIEPVDFACDEYVYFCRQLCPSTLIPLACLG